MKNANNLFQNHLFQSWYLDGLSELSFGFSLLIYGGMHYGFSQINNAALRASFLGIGFPILVIATTYLVRLLVKFFKEKITYPRSGYIRFRKLPAKKKIKNIVLRVGLMVGVMTVVNVLIVSFSKNLTPVLVSFLSWSFISLAFAAIALWQGIRFDLMRFKIIAGIELLLGFITGGWVPEPFHMLSFLGGSGLLWLISGGVVLIQYIRETPVIAEEDYDAQA